MKLLFILENYYPNIGGVETLFQSLMEGLAKQGHEVSLITHRLKGTKKDEILNGVTIHRIDCFHSRYLFSFLAIPKAIKLAKDYDIIHTTTYNGALPSLIAAKLNKKPVIITVHEILGKYWNKFEMPYIAKKFHALAEKIIIKMPFDIFAAVSHSTKNQLLENGVKKRKVVVVYDGVDYKLLNPHNYDGNAVRKELNLRNKFVYISYGRPGITKGIEYLVKAVPIVDKKIPNSQLILVLSERDKRINLIKSLINKMGLGKKILLLKSMEKEALLAHIKAANIVVVPSLTEGFGYSAIEACEMEKILVASNTMSIPEVIYGKYVLVRPADAEALAEGIVMAYHGMVTKSPRKIFTVQDNVRGYVEIYKSLIKI